MIGKIVKGIGGFYYVKTAEKEIIECKARGIFRKENLKPYIGDDVEISVQNGKGNIEKILDRKNLLIRPPVSNIDILVIVVAAKDPKPDLFLTDKLILNAEIAGIKPIICINKSDLDKADDIVEIYDKAGYEVVLLSAKNEKGSENKIMPLIKGKTTAFAGLSGVGKSTLLGVITGVEKETGEISEKIKRGKHTTRHVELIEMDDGGYVLDTPGFSSFEVTQIKAENLQDYFPEMKNHIGECRFKGCSHINEPDCVIKDLVNDGKISKSRYESYKTIYEKLKSVKEWEN